MQTKPKDVERGSCISSFFTFRRNQGSSVEYITNVCILKSLTVLQNLLFIVTDAACLQALNFITIAKAKHMSTMSDDAKSIGCATRTWRYFLVIVYFAVFKRDNEPLPFKLQCADRLLY